jgi:hypothetical protein
MCAHFVELGCGAWLADYLYCVYVNDHCPFTAVRDPTTITKYNPSMPVCPVKVQYLTGWLYIQSFLNDKNLTYWNFEGFKKAQHKPGREREKKKEKKKKKVIGTSQSRAQLISLA